MKKRGSKETSAKHFLSSTYLQFFSPKFLVKIPILGKSTIFLKTATLVESERCFICCVPITILPESSTSRKYTDLGKYSNLLALIAGLLNYCSAGWREHRRIQIFSVMTLIYEAMLMLSLSYPRYYPSTSSKSMILGCSISALYI